jgi:hypothetical protein
MKTRQTMIILLIIPFLLGSLRGGQPTEIRSSRKHTRRFNS